MRPIGDSSVRKYTQARTVATLLHRNYTFSDAMTQYRYSLPADSMRSLPIDSCAIVVDWVARIKQRVLFLVNLTALTRHLPSPENKKAAYNCNLGSNLTEYPSHRGYLVKQDRMCKRLCDFVTCYGNPPIVLAI